MAFWQNISPKKYNKENLYKTPDGKEILFLG